MWTREQIREVLEMYHNKSTLLEISKKMKRTPLETFILLLDLAETGRIKTSVERGFYATL